MRPTVVLAYLACVLIWGTTFFAIRVCIGPDGYATYPAAALRFVIAAAVLAAIVALGWARPVPRSRVQIAWLCAAGMFNFVAYALLYTAEESIPGGLACVIYGTLPLLTALIAGAVGTEKIARSAIVGAMMSLIGIAIIFWDHFTVSTEHALGIAMMIGAVCMASSLNVILKRWGNDVHPFAQNAWFLGATAVPMTLLALLVERPHAAMTWPPPLVPTLAILYLAIVGSVVAFGSYFYLIQRTRLMTAATIVLLQPLIALFVDALWESQPIRASTYLGAAFTIAGVGVNLLFRAASQPRVDAAPHVDTSA